MTPAPSHSAARLAVAAALALAVAAVGIGIYALSSRRMPTLEATPVLAAPEKRPKAPDFEGGVAWLNTDKPIKIADLKGKVVLLDFWTFCCINCIHVMPDLAKLEKKYEKELVVIGVHSAKFDNEKDTAAIRKAILRYQIAHPVVNDAKMEIWNAYDISSWPSLVLIDTEGNIVGQTSGEGKYDVLDRAIGRLIEDARGKTLDEKPMRFALEAEKAKTPLYFPGKILADEATNRLFIADSTHHRVVVTDLAGKHEFTAGTGTAGLKDGPFAEAQFNDPQGLARDGDTLYVADRKNHAIRALDLKEKTVKTVAGTGEQGRGPRNLGGPALKTGLNSPWDILLHNGKLFIAMAGHHQIWTLDLKKGRVDPYAGNGAENIVDGPFEDAEFAQPSGLTSDGKALYVADSEVSAIRSVPLVGGGDVETLVGKGLFKFGDIDGVADKARLQHALGVLYHDGKLYVADTYNSKLKILDPVKLTCTSWLGGTKGEGAEFNEPAGLSYAKGKLYVADTNAHRIRVVDLKTKAIETLKLTGVTPPAAPPAPAPEPK